jgi:uncharacterized protein YggU (UPF0235/DUF167 family)
VHASARRDELVGIRDGVLIVRVAAAPIEGAANRALCRLVARELGARSSSVAVVRGHRSRDKVLEIDGLDHPTVVSALTR